MGKLQIISLTGGLLCLPRPLDQGSRIKLVFLTHTGPVLGAAEMLRPLSWRLQPFQFVTLREGDQHRLRAAIQSSLDLRTGKSSSKPKAPVLFAEELESRRIIDGEQEWMYRFSSPLKMGGEMKIMPAGSIGETVIKGCRRPVAIFTFTVCCGMAEISGVKYRI